jgi:predicted nucleic acid-binding protein
MTTQSAAPGSIELIDANVVLRYLLGDQSNHLARARALIDSTRSLRVSIATVLEVGYVLTRVAGVPRVDAVDAMIELLERENIHVHEVDTDSVIDALRLCRPSGRVSFADAIMWAVTRSAQPARLWTFDKRFPAAGIDVKEP